MNPTWIAAIAGATGLLSGLLAWFLARRKYYIKASQKLTKLLDMQIGTFHSKLKFGPVREGFKPKASEPTRMGPPPSEVSSVQPPKTQGQKKGQ